MLCQGPWELMQIWNDPQNHGLSEPWSKSYGLSWVELCPPPPKIYEILSPRTCECDLIWKQGLCRYNRVKMRSLGWVLIQCDWCPNGKRRKPKTDVYIGKIMWDPKGRRPGDNGVRGWSDASTNQGTPRVAVCHQKLEEARKVPSVNSSDREHGLADTSILSFKPPELWQNQLLLF